MEGQRSSLTFGWEYIKMGQGFILEWACKVWAGSCKEWARVVF